MHEISLVKNIFYTLEEEFPGKMDQLRGIYLTVGILSNIQPLLMQSAFDAVLLDELKYNKASLHVEVLPIMVYCEECQEKSEVNDYKFICAKCGRPCNKIVQGEEMLITKVEFEN